MNKNKIKTIYPWKRKWKMIRIRRVLRGNHSTSTQARARARYQSTMGKWEKFSFRLRNKNEQTKKKPLEKEERKIYAEHFILKILPKMLFNS